MAKTRKKSSSSSKKSAKGRKQTQLSPTGITVSPETQTGIFSIVLLACGLIILLSLFGAAGSAGEVLNNILTALVGVGRYVVPFLFFIVVYTLLYPKDYEIQPIYMIGLALFGVSIFGLLDLISDNSGGWIGSGVTYPFITFASPIVGGVVMVALLIIAILIVFNTSLEKLAATIPAGSVFGRSMRFAVALFSSAGNRIAIAREQIALATEQADSSDEMVVNQTAAAQFAKKQIAGDSGDEEMELNEKVTKKKKKAKKVRLRKHELSDDAEQMPLMEVPKAHRKIDIPFSLLSNKKGKPTSGDIEEHKRVIQQTLANFNIEVEMGPVSVGPTVTQYTFKPASGVKVSQILSLQNDIALALAAHPIRVEAPIPGKSLVGIEVPNVATAKVGLRELFESDVFKKRTSNLNIYFGRNVAGEVFADDLGSMPHLLIAGATGSGKSVCLNTLLLSLLYQNGPDDLKLVLVDPKRVEFTVYDDIPHLLTPVITDVQKTINALKWTVNEMDRRYEILANAKKRDIKSYNKANAENTLPYIVFVIDELADLMITAPREVEAAIVRLAQMARAVGIHLVLATQRPSVDVITGLIKANIPARAAFSTSSLTDSRTILDASGAEKLLGKGDMLFSNASIAKPLRMQGAFVSEEEVHAIVDYLKDKAKADYDDEVVNTQSVSALPQAFNDAEEEDELIPQAKEVIVKSQKASASLLQRRLRVGYARAARILDILEEQGFIGPSNGAKPREILATDTQQAAVTTTGEVYQPSPEEVAEQEEIASNANQALHELTAEDAGESGDDTTEEGDEEDNDDWNDEPSEKLADEAEPSDDSLTDDDEL